MGAYQTELDGVFDPCIQAILSATNTLQRKLLSSLAVLPFVLFASWLTPDLFTGER